MLISILLNRAHRFFLYILFKFNLENRFQLEKKNQYYDQNDS